LNYSGLFKKPGSSYEGCDWIRGYSTRKTLARNLTLGNELGSGCISSLTETNFQSLSLSSLSCSTWKLLSARNRADIPAP
jgi:hypothetical protein